MTLNRIFYGLSLLFFWMMLVIPTTHQAERGALLGLLLIVALAHLVRSQKWQLNKKIALLGAVCVSASILFMLNGAVHGSPGAMQVGGVYVVWPLLFLFIMGVFHTPEDWVPFLKVLVMGGISAALIGLLAVSEGLGFLNFGLIDFLGDSTRIGIAEDTIGFSMPNLATVIFAFPFFLAFLMVPKESTNFSGTWRFYVWVGLLLSVIVLLISGRRAFWLSAAISPFAIIFVSKLCHVKLKLKSLSIIAVTMIVLAVLAILFLGINVEAIWDDFISGFDFSDKSNLSTYTRTEQFVALMHGWMESPIIGAGHGSAAQEFVRSEEVPWAYELSYVALLFHTGIVGVLVYGGAVFWLFVKSVSVVRHKPGAAGMLIPLLAGLMSFLIANISNPYLEKFDYLWTLFLPIAVLNAYLLYDKRQKTHLL